MTGIYDLADLFGERLCGVCWCEPSRFDVVLVPELEETVDADCCAEDATGYVGGIGRCTGFGIQPCDLSVSFSVFI